MQNKPKMYRNNENKVFNNNKTIYVSYKDNNRKVNDINIIRKKINSIINSNEFIYRTKVNIVIDGMTNIKKIIGLKNDNLITIDNEYIPIERIEDIYKEK